MGSEAWYPEVVARVRDAIDQAADVHAFRDTLRALLARPGRVLGPASAAKWPAFVLETCLALDGDLLAAASAAAAVEFAVAAIDVADDLIDDEWAHETIDAARALNAALALGFLAQRCAGQVATRLGAERACRVTDLIGAGGAASCAGQDLDLALETRSMVSEDLAHEMTRRKSGALGAMACQVGAAIATDNPAILELVGVFGGHVGIVAQLLNDLAGIDVERGARGSDLRRRKKTLPVVYALRCAQEEGLSPLLAWYEAGVPADALDEERVVGLFRELGAVDYTWVVADAHRREALRALRGLVRATGRPEVRALRRLIPVTSARRTTSER